MSDEPVPNWKMNQVVHDALSWFADADKRERDADERAKRIAEAHTRGWDQVAKAVNDGFRLVAQAIRDNRR
jgi:triosephosphate isomerase